MMPAAVDNNSKVTNMSFYLSSLVSKTWYSAIPVLRLFGTHEEMAADAANRTRYANSCRWSEQ